MPRAIYSYEPLSSNYQLLLRTIEKNRTAKIIPIQKGLGDKVGCTKISNNGIGASLNATFHRPSMEIEQIETSTIDIECQNRTVGLIKMDVEGFEYNVISGAKNTIERDKPILLISIYHTGKDFFEILPIVKQICPEYKFKFVDIFPSEILVDKIVIGYIS